MICYPLSVDGVLSRTIEAGSGEAVVVLVHGFTSRADRWRGVMPALAAGGYHVFAPDLPGHGFADKSPGSRQTIVGYRDFILGYIDAIGAGKVTLVGTSMGGHVVGAAACQAPERIEKLAMIASLGFAPIEHDRTAAMRAGLRNMSYEDVRARLLRAWGNAAQITDELVREDMRVNTSAGAFDSLSRIVDDLDAHSEDGLVVDQLATLADRFPLLLMWGDADPLVPISVGRTAHARLPMSKLVTISGVRHAPYIERPDLFEPIMIDFLSGRLGRFAASELTYS